MMPVCDDDESEPGAILSFPVLPLISVSSREPVAASPCDSCHAGCCRKFSVPLTARDIHQLTAHRGLDFYEFVCRWEDSDHSLGDGVVPHFYFEDSPGKPFLLGLRATDSAQFPGTRMCGFLTEVGDAGKSQCAVYEDRPLACRAFPYHRTEADLVQIHPDLQAAGPWEGDAYGLCSSPWTVSARQLEQAGRDLDALRAEWSTLAQLAVIWNRQPGSWLNFPNFLAAAHHEAARAA